jgi:membrane-bound ClpP family serine protease
MTPLSVFLILIIPGALFIATESYKLSFGVMALAIGLFSILSST